MMKFTEETGTLKLFIKNMVCNRCKMAVESRLEALGLHPTSVELGEVYIAEESLTTAQEAQLKTELEQLGFELIDDRKSRMIEKIKGIIINMVHHQDLDEQPKLKLSEVIAAALHYDYPYLSKLFSEVEGITIEQYLINQKIEKVKELLVYDELNLSGIAFRMGYSSVAHLSAQFKKITGLPPSHFRHIGQQHRKPLDEVGKK